MTEASTAGRGITVVSASAGSGKTYRLTEEVTKAVSSTADDRVPLDGLVAVTFTRKAHAELAARIRHSLVASGAYEEALRLPLAYLGTVHSACLRLVKEFALDAGLSPNVDVLAGSPSRLLREALERALPEETRSRLDELAARVELRHDGRANRDDWVRDVAAIMDLARSNRIRESALPDMAERSFAGYQKSLPPVLADGPALDAALDREMTRALERLRTKNDGKTATRDAIRIIEDVQKRKQDGEMKWSDWPRLAGAKPTKPLLDCVFELGQAAMMVERHPGLHADLRDLTFAMFDAARIGLLAYQEWKASRRVVDYVDMLDRALDLVDDPRVSGELAERLRLVVVDEFQDTSPIQLALFVRLHERARRSIWVGDRKQCIFEYAGADPALMDDVTSWVSASGGARDRLDKSYRSRRELVELSNELFGSALEQHGFSREEVAIVPTRGAVDGLPPLGVWWLEAKNDGNEAACLAEGVRRLLAKPDDTRVIDRVTKEPRPVRAGDVAVLVATNKQAALIADKLHERGIRSAIARAGLLSTPEGTLVDAALRWLLDDGDSLAAAVTDALTGWGGGGPDEWLAARLAGAEVKGAWREALAEVRKSANARSPVETLDAVLAALDVVRLCARWPDGAQRIANLDALRALVATYEDRCAQDREAATIAGLLRAFDDLREERMVGDELLASDDQHVPSDEGAVVVCTYHRAKGLEWPVVVLAQLDRSEKRKAYDVAPESDGAAFDPSRPLEGRWIRYWPWPFGQTKAVPLLDAMEASAEGVAVARREDKERARLLYVGFTRARDHLVLAVRQWDGAAKKKWLDALRDGAGEPLLALPEDAADGVVGAVRVGALSLEARVMRPGAELGKVEDVVETPRWFVRAGSASPREAYWITPSSLSEDAPAGVVGEIERLGSAMVVEASGYAWDEMGNAVHAFLAADVPGLSGDVRLARATRLLGGLTAHVRPESLVRAGDELRAWVERKWPGAVWRREVVVEGAIAEGGVERRVSGVIDLLLEVGDGLVVIDHKTFPGVTEASWRAQAGKYAGQLKAYARLLAQGERTAVLAAWLHMPVAGSAVQVR